jgi:hypothetical protein
MLYGKGRNSTAKPLPYEVSRQRLHGNVKLGNGFFAVSLQEWRKKPTAGLYADGQMSLPSA